MIKLKPRKDEIIKRGFSIFVGKNFNKKGGHKQKDL